MFILTDGKFYVGENPMKTGEYIRVTSPNQAKDLTFKQARALLQNKKKKLSWVKGFQMLNKETGKVEKEISYYGNGGVFIGEKDFDFDDSIIYQIQEEVNSIIGLAAWDVNQLNSYDAVLRQALQYFDSAISDVKHARLGKRPPEHIRTKVDGISNESEEKRRDVKQTRVYIETLIKAINEQWTIGKIKAELSRAKYVPYKGRTKYFEMVDNLVRDY